MRKTAFPRLKNFRIWNKLHIISYITISIALLWIAFIFLFRLLNSSATGEFLSINISMKYPFRDVFRALLLLCAGIIMNASLYKSIFFFIARRVGSLLSISLFAWLLLKYLQFKTTIISTFDFGYYKATICNILTGNGPFTSPGNFSILNDHFQPILIIIAPFAKLIGVDFLLLIVHVIPIWATFLIAVYFYKRIGSKPAMLAVLPLMLVSYVNTTIGFDYHPEGLALPAILLMLILLRRKENFITMLSFSLFGLWALMVKESIVLIILGIAFIALFRKKYGYAILSFMLIMLGIYLFARFTLPYSVYAGTRYGFAETGGLFTGIWKIIIGLMTFQKLGSIFKLIFSFGLAFFSGFGIGVLPIVLLHLSSLYKAQWAFEHYYGILMLPFALAGLDCIIKTENRLRSHTIMILIFAAMLFPTYFPKRAHKCNSILEQYRHTQMLDNTIENMPPRGNIVAIGNVYPRFSCYNIMERITFPRHIRSILMGDWMIVDFKTFTYPFEVEELRDSLRSFEKCGKINRVFYRNSIYIYRIGGK